MSGAEFLGCTDCRRLVGIASGVGITVARVIDLAKSRGVPLRRCSHFGHEMPLPVAMCMTERGYQLLARQEGWTGANIAAPPDTVELPAWASWQAIAAMLDSEHRNHAPELATAVHAWVAHHADPAANIRTRAVAAFAVKQRHSKGKGGAAERIATVANPGRFKSGGATPTATVKPAAKI